MDRNTKKLVCPECGGENVQIYTEIIKSKKISILGIILSALSGFIVFCSLMVALSTPNSGFINYIDYSRINTAVFWIINVTIPTIVFMISLSTTIILYNIPKSENKFFCCDCKIMNLKNLTTVIYKNNIE